MFPIRSLILLHEGVQIATVIQTEQVRCLRIWERRGSGSRGPGNRRVGTKTGVWSAHNSLGRSKSMRARTDTGLTTAREAHALRLNADLGLDRQIA